MAGKDPSDLFAKVKLPRATSQITVRVISMALGFSDSKFASGNEESGFHAPAPHSLREDSAGASAAECMVKCGGHDLTSRGLRRG